MLSWLSQTFEISHKHHPTIQPMEGLRGFAVFLVFLVHYSGLVKPFLIPGTFEHQISWILWTIGHSGVDLFFVLSGYLIYGLLMRKAWQFKSYIRRRIKRIYPTFLVVFALYLFLSVLFPAENKLPANPVDAGIYITENLLLLPGLLAIKPIVTVAWSLSYELFYYLAVPLVITMTGMSLWSRSWRVIFFIAISLAGFYLGTLLNFHTELLMFIPGILLYEAIDSKALNIPPVGLWALMAAFIVMPFLDGWTTKGAWRDVLLYVCFFLLCLDCFSAGSVTTKIFSWPPLRWYGNMSYSYYLIHGLTLKAAFKVWAIVNPFPGSPGLFWLLLLPMFIITLIPSVLLFVFVEKPFSLRSSRTTAADNTAIPSSAAQSQDSA